MVLRKFRYFFIFLFLAAFELLSFCAEASVSNGQEAYDQVKAFGEKIAEKYKLRYLGSGQDELVDSKKVAWSLSLMSNQQMTIEQVRPIVFSVMAEFWNLITQDKDISLFMHYQRQYSEIYNPTLTPERLGLKLAFWDNNVNRPLTPYVAQIIVADGKLWYFYANPYDQSLQIPESEPFKLY